MFVCVSNNRADAVDRLLILVWIREWSLFTAGGARWNSENRSHSKRAPRSIIARYVFARISESVLLDKEI